MLWLCPNIETAKFALLIKLVFEPLAVPALVFLPPVLSALKKPGRSRAFFNAELEGETSNSIFEVLEEWESQLKAIEMAFLGSEAPAAKQYIRTKAPSETNPSDHPLSAGTNSSRRFQGG